MIPLSLSSSFSLSLFSTLENSLCKPETIEGLLNHIVKDPPAELDETLKYK